MSIERRSAGGVTYGAVIVLTRVRPNGGAIAKAQELRDTIPEPRSAAV